MALCEQLLINGGLAKDNADANAQLEHALRTGKAAEYFTRMVVEQGGPADFVENYANYFETAPVIKPLFAPHSGILNAMDTRSVGIAVIGLGGGRRVASDVIDLRVGFDQILPLGTRVDAQTPLAVIHAKDETSWQQAAQAFLAAVTIDEQAYTPTPEIYQIIR